MNLAKLFEMQKQLDEHIMKEHPELRNQDNLDWKVLALQVELGECANEWRGFKKWSNDQEPRTHKHEKVKCIGCNGRGFKKEKGYILANECEFCDGLGYRVENKNPLLEEYVDCLHFILSIGLEIRESLIQCHDIDVLGYEGEFSPVKLDNVMNQFKELFNAAYWTGEDDHYEYVELVELFLGLGKMLGFARREIEQAYFEKNKINHQRQESGY